MGSLDGRVAFVTGAGSGIGKAVALRYVRAGAGVVGFDRDRDALFDTRTAAGGVLVPVDGDVRDPDRLAHAVDRAVESFGGLDIVAAVAGVSVTGSLLSMTDAERDLIFGVNLVGVWNTIRASLPPLLKQGQRGRILVCGSVESVLGGAGLAAYVASKHGVVGLVKSVALELASTGVTANVISPAGVDTDMLRSVVPAEAIAHIAESTPLKRLSTPDEVAAFFEFLAGPDSGYMTGANIVIDGGVVLLNSHTAGQDWTKG